MTARFCGRRVCAVYGPTISVWGSTAWGGAALLDVLYWFVQFEGDVFGDKFFRVWGADGQLRQLSVGWAVDTPRTVGGPRVSTFHYFRSCSCRVPGWVRFGRFFWPSSPFGRIQDRWRLGRRRGPGCGCRAPGSPVTSSLAISTFYVLDRFVLSSYAVTVLGARVSFDLATRSAQML